MAEEIMGQSYDSLFPLIILIILIIIVILIWYHLRQQKKIKREMEIIKNEVLKLKQNKFDK